MVGAGCPSPSGAPTASRPVASSGCSHPYYPLRPGSSITYRMTTGENVNTLKVSVTENTGDQAKLTYAFPEGGINIDQTLTCESGGLFSESYLDLASEVSGMNFRSETKSASGPLLPEGLGVGSEWDSSFDIVVHVDSGPVHDAGISEINETFSIHRKAEGFESVTVPAGTFNALKIQSHFTVATTGVPGMSSLSFDTTEYWVEGIGYVKTASESGGVVSVIEATEIVK